MDLQILQNCTVGKSDLPNEYKNSLNGMQSIFDNESGPVALNEDYMDNLRVIGECDSNLFQYFSEIDLVDESGKSVNTQDIIDSIHDSVLYLDI